MKTPKKATSIKRNGKLKITNEEMENQIEFGKYFFKTYFMESFVEMEKPSIKQTNELLKSKIKNLRFHNEGIQLGIDDMKKFILSKSLKTSAKTDILTDIKTSKITSSQKFEEPKIKATTKKTHSIVSKSLEKWLNDPAMKELSALTKNKKSEITITEKEKHSMIEYAKYYFVRHCLTERDDEAIQLGRDFIEQYMNGEEME